MELSLILNALRRYWWVIVVFTGLGALPGLLVEDAGTNYQSKAVLLISPPSESQSQVSFSSDPDRYVIGQLSVLTSEALAERVANSIGEGASTNSVLSKITIVHKPRTDIVEITAVDIDPLRAQQAAQAYVDLYFDSIRQQVEDAQQPQIDQLEDELSQVGAQLATIDADIAEAMAPFLPTATGDDLAAFPPIPGLEVVAPDLVSQKQNLLAEYGQLLSAKAGLELNARLKVTSEVVQRATLPIAPVIESSKMLVAGGAIAGMFIGLLLAVTIARLSAKVVGSKQVAEILSQPLVGDFPYSRALAKNPVPIDQVPIDVSAFVDALCVRAEASAHAANALVIVVTGTERSAGSTTLAATMANRFALSGSQVLLVDADTTDPRISLAFPNGAGIPAFLAQAARAGDAGRRPVGRSNGEPLATTSIPGLAVLGLGNKLEQQSLRRHNVPQLVEAAAAQAHVVIFDGGPLASAASTVQLMQLADTVVLAVPVKRQRVLELEAVARLLHSRRGELLPVSMPASSRGRRKKPTTTRVVVSDNISIEADDRPVANV